MKKSLKSKPLPKFRGKLIEHKTIESFRLGIHTYFEFDEDVYFLPFRRGLMAATFYKELQQGVDRDYLLWIQKELNGFFNPIPNVPMDFARAAIIWKQFKERTEFIFEPDLIYKLASVVFFDKTEDPYNYSMTYGQEKIRYWKENESVEVFFCRQPIKKLIPFLKQAEQDILSYLLAAESIKKQHTKDLITMPSKTHSMSPNP